MGKKETEPNIHGFEQRFLHGTKRSAETASAKQAAGQQQKKRIKS